MLHWQKKITNEIWNLYDFYVIWLQFTDKMKNEDQINVFFFNIGIILVHFFYNISITSTIPKSIVYTWCPTNLACSTSEAWNIKSGPPIVSVCKLELGYMTVMMTLFFKLYYLSCCFIKWIWVIKDVVHCAQYW